MSAVILCRQELQCLLNDGAVLDEMLAADEDMEFRFLIAELGYPVKLIEYRQNKRKSGKSSYNIKKYFSFAMESMIWE